MSGKNITFEDYMEMIKMYAPCMDDYPYVMDLERDVYYISEKAVDRFNIPGALFDNAIKTHGEFVHKDDVAVLTKDLNDMMEGKRRSTISPTDGWIIITDLYGLTVVAGLSKAMETDQGC